MQGRVTQRSFQKAHSAKEIANYVMDLDAPKLTLAVQPWHAHARLAYAIVMAIVTVASVFFMVWSSRPEEYYEKEPDRGISKSAIPALELACVLYFTVDYLLRLCVTHREWGDFVLDGFNLIDLVTIVPYYFELIILSAGGDAQGLGVLFVVRALRLAKLGRYSPMLLSVLDSIKATYDVLLLFVLCYIIIVFWSGTVYYYVENTKFDNSTGKWMRPCPQIRQHVGRATLFQQPSCATYASNPGELFEVSPVQSVPDGIYWGFIVTSTLGTRLNAPVTPGARIVAAITVFIGVLLFAVPVTVLTASFRQIRRKAEALLMFRKIDLRTTVAMKAQEKLKRELSYAQRNKESSDGQIRYVAKRRLEKVTSFIYEGVERPIYQAVLDQQYYYPPLCILERDPETGGVRWADDFNPTTSQRVVSCLVVLDNTDAQNAARDALADLNIVPEEATENDVLVCADPRAVLNVSHDFSCSFKALNTVVEFDRMRDSNATYLEQVPLRFVINMSHIYPAGPVTQLLKETRIKVTVLTPLEIDEVNLPLSTDIVMASRFVRELSQIAYKRPVDGALLAYVHHSDGAELLRGFTEQFVPTPTKDDIVLDPYFVDTQLFHSLTSSLPRIMMSQIPHEAAAAFYRGKHLTVDLSEEPLILVNISALSQWDLLGFGRRFRVTVPMARVERTDVQFQLS